MRLRRFAEARIRLERALAIRTDMDGATHGKTADVRFHLAELAFGEDAFDVSLKEAIGVLALSGLHGSPDLVWRVFDLIGRILESKGRRRLAILFGKEAVAIIEHLRLGVTDVGRRLEQQFMFSRASGYRNLVDQLASDHRLAEAEHVLERLRAAEHNELFGRHSGSLPVEQPGFTGWEDDRRRPYADALDRIVDLRSELSELLESGGAADAITAIRTNIAKTAKKLSVAVVALVYASAAGFVAPAANSGPDMFGPAGPMIGTKDIFLHVFAADSHLWVLRRDGRGGVNRIEVDEATINNLVFDFRYALSDPAMPVDAIKAAGARLYNLLLRPVLDDQPPRGSRLILWLEGALRFMPPAVLFDGEYYLIEKIPVSLYSPFAKPSAVRRVLKDNGVAGFALTRKVEGFAPLPFAVDEVQAVVGDGASAGLFKGEGFLDQRFTPETLQQAAGQFGGLLIASHFVLRPADLMQSGLLTGTGAMMPLHDIAALHLDGLRLVTLSSCDSGSAGVDSETAVLQSFADRLLLCGAGAVLASLWRVADAASARLVIQFYANLASRDGENFAAALASAQAAMLHGFPSAVYSGENTTRGIGGKSESDDGVPANADFRHPYYWAPFIVLGDGADAQ